MRAGERLDGRFLLRHTLVPESVHEGARKVWLAHDELIGRDVVLKRVVRGEPRAMAELNHPHVITVYEVLSVAGDGDDAGYWAVMEYAPRGSLLGLRMSLGDAAGIGAQIASALVFMHAKGLVHCDVEPGNIVITGNDVAKLTDFGSAYRLELEATITSQGPIGHTPGYGAPEAVAGKPVPTSDVYSLAATVYALVVGTPPEQAEARPDLGPLREVLSEMLRRNPIDRPDAAEARRRLQAIADGAGPMAGRTTSETTVPPAPKPRVSATVVPAQLPADVYGFAGRGTELDELDQLLSTPAEQRPTAVVISAISGTAGVGKTALALHWAHRSADRFPDGQLYVNLRGFDPSGQVVDPADAIRGFLAALGVPPERIPTEQDAQAALYRSLLDGKQVLVVLDNARGSDQIRPLLPGGPGCLAVVTSRNHLVDLIAKQAARPLDLDVLTETDARRLLERRLGRDRTAAEPEAVDEIRTACANLPLALAIVAARGATRPDFPLASLAAELRDHARLDVLTGEGPDTDVRAVFSWSYENLGAEAQRLFRLLGMHPGPDISAPAAASLAGIPPADVRPLLAELTGAHLVAEHMPGRYTFHDLLRAYARELAHTHDTEDDRHAATHRMLDHYLHTADVADRQLDPQRDVIALTTVRPGVTVERLADHEHAMTWFAAEHTVLLTILDDAAKAGFDIHAWQLAWTLPTFLERQGHWYDYVGAWRTALAATQRLGDRSAQALAARLLARAYLLLDHLDDAHAHLRHALDLCGGLGDRPGQAHALQTLSMVSSRQGRHADALGYNERALELYREVDDRLGQAIALNGIGWDHVQLGQYELALANCGQALELFQEVGDDRCEADTWDSLGYARHHLSQFEAAATCYRHALDLYRGVGARYQEADTLSRLGDTQLSAGDHDAAHASWQRALTILDELGHPDAEGVRTKLENHGRSE